MALVLLCLFFLPSSPVLASGTYNQTCDLAAAHAAKETGVPVSVLQAITRTETGRNKNGVTKPWPWTVNMEGKGVWFANIDDAKSYVHKNYNRGARSFDVGCFQINYKWHGQAFASIDQMFDPDINALYAAKFLLSLFQEKGDWGLAAGAYHSRTPKYATKYQARFSTFREKVLASAKNPLEGIKLALATHDQVKQTVYVNNYPLLKPSTARRGLGSLVPLSGKDQPANPFIMLANDG